MVTKCQLCLQVWNPSRTQPLPFPSSPSTPCTSSPSPSSWACLSSPYTCEPLQPASSSRRPWLSPSHDGTTQPCLRVHTRAPPICPPRRIWLHPSARLSSCCPHSWWLPPCSPTTSIQGAQATLWWSPQLQQEHHQELVPGGQRVPRLRDLPRHRIQLRWRCRSVQGRSCQHREQRWPSAGTWPGDLPMPI